MAEMSYLDFDLSIEGEHGQYQARVLNSPAGQATHSFSRPFSEPELENFILRIGRPRQGVRCIDSPEMEAVPVPALTCVGFTEPKRAKMPY